MQFHESLLLQLVFAFQQMLKDHRLFIERVIDCIVSFSKFIWYSFNRHHFSLFWLTSTNFNGNINDSNQFRRSDENQWKVNLSWKWFNIEWILRKQPKCPKHIQRNIATAKKICSSKRSFPIQIGDRFHFNGHIYTSTKKSSLKFIPFQRVYFSFHTIFSAFICA